MRVELCIGGDSYSIPAKRIDVSVDGVFVKITDFEGTVFETSPHNVLIIHEKEKDGEY